MREGGNTYHHGDLARAALDAAYVLVAEGGVAALSMREVAGRLDVTHRALYRHYADREALLDAVAARGYEALAGALQSELARTAPGSVARAFLTAYAGFALADDLRHPVTAMRPGILAVAGVVVADVERHRADGRPATRRVLSHQHSTHQQGPDCDGRGPPSAVVFHEFHPNTKGF